MVLSTGMKAVLTPEEHGVIVISNTFCLIFLSGSIMGMALHWALIIGVVSSSSLQ
jgi:hypothetical protein